MTDIKCPFCGKEMICGGTICRFNPDCPIYDKPVPTEVLELLDRTRKALDVAVDALKIIGSGKVIEHSVMFHEDDNKIFIANKALEQIKALEQKD